jgi:hypothetical protein
MECRHNSQKYRQELVIVNNVKVCVMKQDNNAELGSVLPSVRVPSVLNYIRITDNCFL